MTNKNHEEIRKIYASFQEAQIPLVDNLQSLAEEASELSQACLQAMRALGVGPVSRKSVDEAFGNLSIELADVILDIGVLMEHPSMQQIVSRENLEDRIVSTMDYKMMRHMKLMGFIAGEAK